MGKAIKKIKASVLSRFGLRAIRGSSFFDSEWYRDYYGISDGTDCARHYLNTGWKLGFDPSVRFSTIEYLSHYADVFEIGMNPLLHYEKYGKDEGRQTVFSHEQEREMEAGGFDYVYEKDPPKEMKSCAVFAASCDDQVIPDYVVYYLEKLSKVVDGIVFISYNRIRSYKEINKIRQFVFYAEFFGHRSSSFGLWKKGIRLLSDKKLLSELDELVLSDDSCYGPVEGFEYVFSKMSSEKCDYWRMLDPSGLGNCLRSVFYVFRRNIIRDDDFLSFFDLVPESLILGRTEKDFDKELTEKLSLKYAPGCFMSDTDIEAGTVAKGDPNTSVTLFSLLEKGLPLVLIRSLVSHSKIDCFKNAEKTLLFIREHNRALYNIVTADVKHRLLVKKESFHSCFSEFSAALENKTTVSFDVFDTLLIRPFYKATDLFNYIEKEYAIRGFSSARIEAEITARYNKKLNYGTEEVSIEEIYDVIVPKFKTIKEIELAEEASLIRANLEMKWLYEVAVSFGKRIIAISDMYLSKRFIKSLLLKNGYQGIEEVFVSSENNHNKGSGELYAEALNYLNCDKSEIVHFGDNFKADVECAGIFGVDAHQTPQISKHIIATPENKKYKEFLEMHDTEIAVSIYTALISKYCSETDPATPFYSLLGYTLGGCLALSYLNYICEEAVNNEVDHLMFVARDGYSLMEIYKEFFIEKYKFPCSYVYLNRNVVLGVLDEMPEDPRYLYSTLKLAKKEIPSIVVSDDEELNTREYCKHKNEIETWKKRNREIVKAHLNSMAGNAENICVVDMTTGRFSSLYGAKTVLGDRIKLGLFTGVFPVAVSRAPYESFCERKLDSGDDLAIKFSELLLTSPEESIEGLDEYGQPVYDHKVENDRQKRYYEIIAGIKEYCRDYMKIFPVDKKLLLTLEQWIDLVNCYCKFCNETDKYYLNDVVESPDPDVSHVKNSLVTMIEEKQNNIKLKKSVK